MRKKRKVDESVYDDTAKKTSYGLKRAFALSIILNLIDRFTNAVYEALERGFFGRILTGYSSLQCSFEGGSVRSYFSDIGGLASKLHKLRLKVSEAIETSLFHRLLRKLIAALLSMPLKYYGNFLLSFSLYSVVIGFVRGIIPGFEVPQISFFVVDAVILLLALPLLASKQSMAEALRTGRISRLIVFEMCGCKDESFEIEERRTKRKSNIAVIAGMVAGLMTFFADPIVIPVAIISLLVFAMIMTSPEIGVVVSIFIIPFLSLLDAPSLVLGILVSLTGIGYIIKLVRGKRSFKLELFDLSVVIFMIIVIMSGVITAGGRASFAAALLASLLMCGFFLAVNLLRSEKWLNRCVLAFLCSAVVVAIVGILEYLFGFASAEWLDLRYFSDIEGRVVSLFDNPNILGVYLAMAFPFAMVKRRSAETSKGKFLATLACILILACAVLTWSRSAWLAIIISAILFLLINSRRIFKSLIGIACIAPVIIYMMPRSVAKRFLSIGDITDSSSYYRLCTWRGSISAARDHIFGGIGYGTQAYTEIYPQYAYAGIEAAEHSHNLFLQILLETGIFGLLVFVVMIFLFVQKNYEFFKHGEERTAVIMASAAFCAVVAALVYGVFDHLFYNFRILYVFWIVAAISCSYIRYGENETRRKKIVEYSSPETASVDI